MTRATIVCQIGAKELCMAVYETYNAYMPKAFSAYTYTGEGSFEFPLTPDSEELHEVLEIFRKAGETPRLFSEVRYTGKEIENTRYFEVREQHPLELEGTDAGDYGTRYEGGCPRCGRGGTRVGNILVDRKFMKNKKFGTLFPDRFASAETRDIIEQYGLTGISFGEPVLDYKGRDMQTYYAVHIDSVLPPLGKDTWLEVWEPPLCEACGFRRHYLRSDLQYEAEKLENAKDFNVTMERLDNYDIPQIVISARARRAFLEAKYRPWHFLIPVTLL